MLIYTSHLSQGKKVGLLSNTLLQIERVRSKKCIEGALDSLNIRWESRKIILKEEQERFRGMVCKMGLTRLHDFYGS